RGQSNYAKVACIAAVRNRQLAAAANGLNAGNRAQPLQQGFMRLQLVGWLREPSLREANSKTKKVVMIEAGIDVQQTVEAFSQQSRSSEKHHGQGYFTHYQAGSKAPPGARV